MCIRDSSDIKANPTIENVQTGVKAYRDSKADYIIAIGGGSSMDTAKAIGIIINNPEHEDVRSLEGAVVTKNKCVPTIAVPTTAGTAAEVTINYVITDVEKNRKFVCVDPHDIPVVAVIDPDMMSTMPAGLTAATGMDALTHAIEGFITKAAWDMTDMFHLKAIEIISDSLRGAVKNTKEGREGMALGQYLSLIHISSDDITAVIVKNHIDFFYRIRIFHDNTNYSDTSFHDILLSFISLSMKCDGRLYINSGSP